MSQEPFDSAGPTPPPNTLWDIADRDRPLFYNRRHRYCPITAVARWQPRVDGVDLDVAAEDGSVHPLRISFATPHVVRVQLGPQPSAPSDLLVAPPEGAPCTVATEPDALVLQSTGLVVRLGLRPWQLTVLWPDGRGLYAEQTADRTFHAPVAYPLGFAVNERGERSTFESFALHHDEHLFGLGQHYGPLNRRGQRIVAWSRDTTGLNTAAVTYTNIPFLLSSRGFGVFLHHPQRIVYELGSVSFVTASFQVDAPYLDYFVIAGPHPKTVLQRYADLTGYPPVPPVWSLGVWMSRCMYRNRQEVEEVVDRARADGFPLDVVHLDPLWLRERRAHRLDACTFTWDEEAFPSPAEFIASLRERGVRLCLWENPYVWMDTPFFEEGARRGYFARLSDGRWATSLENAEAAIVDFTNPEAVAWIQERHRALLRQGVAAFKTDYGEGVPEDARFADGRTGREVHNLYPLLYNRAVFEVVAEETGEGIVFGRSGYAGSQRYPVLWTGDAQSTFEGLAGALRAGLSLSLSGVAFWSHDIGGFWAPGDAPPSPELYVRWAQVGLLSSHARFHGTQPREPWVFGEEAYGVVARMARLRYRLLPYFYQLAHEAHATGLPVVRPLYLEFPDDPLTPHLDTEFLLGPFLLAAPVLDSARERQVYLPEGRWYDFWDGTPLDGPRSLRWPAPLDRIPLFVREDSVLPTIAERRWVDESPWAPLELTLRVARRAEAVVPLPSGPSVHVGATRDGDRLHVRLRGEWPVRLVLPGWKDVRHVALQGCGDDARWWIEGTALHVACAPEGEAIVEIAVS